jgi:predicted acyltransferase
MKNRFYSLDVFRGATVAFMILVNNPGTWSAIFPPLDHAPWHGCTPTDLVFPFFLFAVGNAMAFVMPRLHEAGDKAFWKKVTVRTLLILAIGIFLNWSPFVRWENDALVFKHWVNPDNPLSGVRVTGVLQRIAFCYFFASVIIYYAKPRVAAIIGAALLLVYWILTYTLGDLSDPYSMAGYFGNAIDQAVLGVPHLYKGEKILFDPEGLAGVLSATVEVVIGYLAGRFIVQRGKTFEMVTTLLLAGCALVFVGYCWDMIFPINKKIWTSSYTVYTSGLAIITICFLLYWIELKNKPAKGLKFFEVFGKNPLFIFVLSGFLPRVLGLLRWPAGINSDGKQLYTSVFPWFYEHICRPLSSNLKIGSLIYAIITVLFYWMLAYWLDRKKIYIKV